MKKIIILLAGLMLASVAQANHGGAHGHNYGMAGCGLGSMWMGDDSVVKQVFAATTNGSSYNQLFGISSGTSNCVDEGTVRAAREADMYIETNQVALANDIARGSGEALEHLAKVLGCADSGAVGAALQKRYDSIFSTDNIKNERISSSIIGAMKNDSGVSQQCNRLI